MGATHGGALKPAPGSDVTKPPTRRRLKTEEDETTERERETTQVKQSRRDRETV